MKGSTMKKMGIILCFALICLCLGCATTAPTIHQTNVGAGLPLEKWIDKALTPYLAETLGKHPKYCNTPILIVGMHNDNILSRIDDLTFDIRNRLAANLKGAQGVSLVWKPETKPWRNHQSLSQVLCPLQEEIPFYLGLDVSLTPADNLLCVKVGVLNVNEGTWDDVSLSWQGKPTKQQLKALKTQSVDASLKGMRPLPFSSNEPDLLGAYLAGKLSCFLKSQFGNNIVLFKGEDKKNTDSLFSKGMDLVYNYLETFSEVSLTNDAAKATLFLKTQVHRIDQDLYQVWVSLGLSKTMEESLPGAVASAYVNSDSTAAAVVEPLPADTALAQNHQSADAQVLTACGSPEILPEKERADQPTPEQNNVNRHDQENQDGSVITPDKTARRFISKFNLITPKVPEMCATPTPWLVGYDNVAQGSALRSGTCMAVELAVTLPCRLFLFDQDSSNRISMIYPENMLNLQDSKRLALCYPPIEGDSQNALELTNEPGKETVYAIAIRTDHVAGTFLTAIENLFQGETGTSEYENFILLLKRMKTNHGNGFDFKTRWFIHKNHIKKR